MGNSPLFMRHSHVASAIAPLLSALNETESDEEPDYAALRQPRVRARWFRHPEYDHVGVLPINDVIYHGDQDYYYYGQSYASILANMRSMDADDSISVLTQVHRCYGGTAAGCGATATSLEQLRLESSKPVLALSDESMYSASMYIAAGSAGEDIYVTPSAGNASIGTIIPHMEFSKMLEKEGINFTAIRSGDRKARGGQFESLDKDTKAELQGEVDKLGGQFIEFVADSMGLSAQAVRDLEGGTLMGQDSVDAGLAKDVVQTTDEFFQIAASAAQPKKTTVILTNQQDHSMSGGKKPDPTGSESTAMEYTPEQVAEKENAAVERYKAKLEKEQKEAEAKAAAEEARLEERKEQILESTAAVGKSEDDVKAVIANVEDFPTAKSAITALKLAPVAEEKPSKAKQALQSTDIDVDFGGDDKEFSKEESKQLKEDEKMYGMVLEFVAEQHGEDSDHYREMKSYAAIAIQEDRELGTAISGTTGGAK